MELVTGTVELNGAALYYELAGAGLPVVLIHAGIANSHMWDDQFSVFAGHYQVLRYDMRGFGNSNNPDGPFSHYEDLCALLDHLKINQVHLVGVSIGGTTALDFALSYPNMVKSLVTVGSTPSGYTFDTSSLTDDLRRVMLELYNEMREAEAAGDVLRLEELELRMWVDGPYRKPNQVDPRVRSKVREMNHRAFELANAKATGRWAFPPAVERLPEIVAPTLAIAGSLDVPNVLAAVDLLESDIPNARKAIIPGTAHVPNMEQPAEFNRIVLNFLNEIS